MVAFEFVNNTRANTTAVNIDVNNNFFILCVKLSYDSLRSTR